ncbi:MAG: 3-deoxy-D-manno-octulosonic acid transferase, partial [Desulfobacterales bacterium]|nr:3-deoxy-D-manno-octulosonic acid transferase [Desulfobacterales bacterium]
MFPFFVVKALTLEKRRATVLKRLYPGFRVPRFRKRPIWIHTLSVGEVLSAITLIKAIKEQYPDRALVCSVSTRSGYQVATKSLSKKADLIFFFPYDFLWVVRRFIRRINSVLFLLVETDLWPNFLHEMKRRQVPTILVNGRLSPRSFSGYKLLSFFMRPVFSGMSVVCAQSKLDAQRFEAVGTPAEKIKITGNIKFDQKIDLLSDEEIDTVRKSMKIKPGSKIFLAGSTHEGEESILVDVFSRLKKSFNELVLVIVPRDPKRAKAVYRLFVSSGHTVALMTDLKKISSTASFDVIVVDAMGTLRRLYALADIAFVGGSLVKRGGQNPLEPAAFARPVIFGPDMNDFYSIAEMLI